MTDSTDARADDPKWLIDQLRAEATAAAADPELPETATEVEQWADEIIGRSTVGFPAVVEAAADQLMPAAKVSPEARKRFIAAAERSLAVRRAELGLLPVVLAAARKKAGLSVDDVQHALDAGECDVNVSDLESGKTSLHDARPKVTARWIHSVRLDRQAALDAARRSLEADPRGVLRPAAGTGTGTLSANEWLAQLITELDFLEQT